MSKVTDTERNQIQDFLREQEELYYDVDYDIMPSRITVIRGYTSDGPGWCGDIYFIVWGEANFITIVGRESGQDPNEFPAYKILYDITDTGLSDVGWV